MRMLGTVVWLFLLAGTVEGAGPEDRAKAKTLYEQATTHYKLGELDQALAKFRETYRLVQDPVLLFNIGQCYRQLNQYPEAIRTFKAYLTDVPNSPARTQVREMITQMETAVRESGKAKMIPPVGLENEKPHVSEPEPPQAAPPPPAPAPPPPAVEVVAKPAPPPPPRRRMWVWGVVGGVAAAAALGLGLGLGLGLQPHDPSPTAGTVRWQ